MKKIFLVLLALSSTSMAFAKEGNSSFEARLDRRTAAAQDAQAKVAPPEAVEIPQAPPAATSDDCGTCC